MHPCHADEPAKPLPKRARPFGARPRARRIVAVALWAATAAVLSVGLVLAVRDQVEHRATASAQDAQPDPSRPTVASCTRLTDWPQWRGPRRDGTAIGQRLADRWPPGGPPVVWRQGTTGPGYSSVTVAGGLAYTMMQDGPDEAIVCMEAATGRERWRYRYRAAFVSDQGSGPRSTPTIDEGRVYAVGATGLMHCLDARTGRLIWRRDLVGELGGRVPEWGVSFSPLVDGDLVFVQPGGADGRSLAALDKRTGAVRWQSLDDRPGYASPVIANVDGRKQVLFFTAEGLVSVEPETGRLNWRFPWTTPMDANIATPVVQGDFVFISSGYGRGCALLRVVPLGGGGSTAELVYRSTVMRNHFSTSVPVGDHLFGFDGTRLTCVEFRTGRVRWSRGGFRKGSLIACDGKLIVLGEYGKLALVRATPERYDELASVRLCRHRTWTPPSLADGMLFIRDEEEIICLDLTGRREANATAGSQAEVALRSDEP